MPFKKGDPNINREGRPRKPEIQQLRDALAKVESETGISFIEHFVRQSYKCKEIAIALAKKILPDQLEGTGFAGSNITNIFSGEQIAATERRELIEAIRARRSQRKPT